MKPVILPSLTVRAGMKKINPTTSESSAHHQPSSSPQIEKNSNKGRKQVVLLTDANIIVLMNKCCTVAPYRDVTPRDIKLRQDKTQMLHKILYFLDCRMHGRKPVHDASNTAPTLFLIPSNDTKSCSSTSITQSTEMDTGIGEDTQPIEHVDETQKREARLCKRVSTETSSSKQSPVTQVPGLSVAFQESLVRMFSVNIFARYYDWDCLSMRPSSSSTAMAAVNAAATTMANSRRYRDLDEMSESSIGQHPAWPQLELLCIIFLRYLDQPTFQIAISQKFVDKYFLLQLLEKFNSEEHHLKEMLKVILHKIYLKFVSHRALIRQQITNTFYSFVYEREDHEGISTLLEVMSSVIAGYSVPLKEEHRKFLHSVLLPLHKPQSIALYHSQLTTCVRFYLDKEPGLATDVLTQLMRFWPKYNSFKEILFLSEMEEIVTYIPGDCLLPMQELIFHRVATCILSPHAQVAEKALNFWGNDYILNFMKDHLRILLPIVFPALCDAKLHWNPRIRDQAQTVLVLFMDMNQRVFDRCARQHAENIRRGVDSVPSFTIRKKPKTVLIYYDSPIIVGIGVIQQNAVNNAVIGNRRQGYLHPLHMERSTTGRRSFT